MAKKPKRITQTQREYNEELKRVQRLRKRAEYMGYRFEKNPIPITPKKITEASVRKLKNITAESMMNQAKFIETNRGTLTGSKKTQYIPQAEANYLNRIYNEILTFSPNPTAPQQIRAMQDENNNALLGLLTNAIARDGENVVAKRIANTSQDIADIISTIQYDSKSENVSHNIQRFAEIVNGGRLDWIDAQMIGDFINDLEYMDEL